MGLFIKLTFEMDIVFKIVLYFSGVVLSVLFLLLLYFLFFTADDSVVGGDEGLKLVDVKHIDSHVEIYVKVGDDFDFSNVTHVHFA